MHLFAKNVTLVHTVIDIRLHLPATSAFLFFRCARLADLVIIVCVLPTATAAFARKSSVMTSRIHDYRHALGGRAYKEVYVVCPRSKEQGSFIDYIRTQTSKAVALWPSISLPQTSALLMSVAIGGSNCLGDAAFLRKPYHHHRRA